MGVKKYLFINGLPTIEFIVTLFLSFITFCFVKIYDGTRTSLFNFMPFLILTIVGWIICLFRLYKFIRVYLSDDITQGVILSVNEDMVRIGCMSIASRSVIQVLNIRSGYARMLQEDMLIKFKTHGRWLEILDTNRCYQAYKNNEEYEPYMIFEWLSMKFFAALERRGLI